MITYFKIMGIDFISINIFFPISKIFTNTLPYMPIPIIPTNPFNTHTLLSIIVVFPVTHNVFFILYINIMVIFPITIWKYGIPNSFGRTYIKLTTTCKLFYSIHSTQYVTNLPLCMYSKGEISILVWRNCYSI